MRKTVSFLLALAVIISLSACGSGSVESKATEPKSTKAGISLSDSIDALLQGSWSYHDETGYNEIFSFSNGNFSYKTHLDNIRDSGSENSGSYEIGDGYIRLVFKNGYVNDITCELSGTNLILSKYIDSGADAGTTRVFVKDYGYINIPSSGSSQSTPKQTPSKDIPKTDNATSGMRNALKEAKSYLSVMPFSYEGLIEQLEYEGYSHSEAVYGVNNCGADWYEQAVKSAKNYLEIMAFSRSGLIEQLEYEGYTHDQAVYGVDKAY